eukprot:13855347-Heterocapsa_arctica.AAC.1
MAPPPGAIHPRRHPAEHRCHSGQVLRPRGPPSAVRGRHRHGAGGKQSTNAPATHPRQRGS